jgi:hypothetical protein
MSYTAHTESKEGFTLEVVNDEDPQNPRTEWDHVGKMICFHGRYTLGDKHDFADPEAFHDSKEFKEAVVKLPLYLLDHSGLSMSTGSFNDPWDSGQVGYIIMSREDAIREWGKKKLTKKVVEAATKCLQAEVTEYNQYLTGDVYGCVVKNQEGEEVESCWGFYGLDYAKEEGKSMLDAEIAFTKKNDKECEAIMAL